MAAHSNCCQSSQFLFLHQVSRLYILDDACSKYIDEGYVNRMIADTL